MGYKIKSKEYFEKLDRGDFLLKQINNKINNLENQAKTYSELCKKNYSFGNKEIAKIYFYESERIYKKEIPKCKKLIMGYNNAKENLKKRRVEEAKKGRSIEEIRKTDNYFHINLINLIQGFL